MRRARHIILAIIFIYFLASVPVGTWLADTLLHPWHKPLGQAENFRAVVRDQFHSEIEDVSVTSHKALLHAWYIQPDHYNGNAIILLHGIADNREGVTGYARMFLHRGYSVLLPDARAHGESGGSIATYGILERDDVAAWTSLLHQQGADCVFGFGESMGAALVTQGTASRSLCAAAAEAPFASLRDAAYDRLAMYTYLPIPVARVVGWFPVEVAYLYTRLHQGLDLDDASPPAVLRESQTPTLLIAGDRDRLIRERNAQMIHRAAPDSTELWLLNVGHCGAVGADPTEFERRILTFFSAHANKNPAQSAGLPVLP